MKTLKNYYALSKNATNYIFNVWYMHCPLDSWIEVGIIQKSY